MRVLTRASRIVSDPVILGGEPIVEGTRTPVRAIVENWRLGIPPEEIPLHLPHLTLAQVFEALSYFSDHPEEIMRHIEENRIPDDRIGTTVRLPRAGALSRSTSTRT